MTASPAVAAGCFIGYSPEVYAEQCPVIVRGKIVSVDVAKDEGDDKKRVDDTADVEITEVVKNEFKDVPLKAGGKLKVRMVSDTKNRLQSSTDLHYPAKTEALWLVAVDDAGEFRIDLHPVQKQPIDAKLKPGRRVDVAVEKKADEPKEKDEPGVVRGTVLKSDWLKERAKRDAEEKKRAEEYEAKRLAEEKAVKELAAALANADRIDDASMKAYIAAPVDVRRSLIQLREKSPLVGDQLVEVAAYVLRKDPDDNIRIHALVRLGGDDLKENKDAGQVLVKALVDRPADERRYACQSLGMHGDADLAPYVRVLLADREKDVRHMAVTTLGRLGYTKAVSQIVRMYEDERPGPDAAYDFAECLARLGETKVSVAAAVKAMASDNWNVRYFAVAALDHVKGDAAVAPLVDCLRLELKRIVAGETNTGFDERMYATACKLLADRTGEKHGLDPLAWADWWATARTQHAGAEWAIDRNAVKKAFAAYQSKK